MRTALFTLLAVVVLATVGCSGTQEQGNPPDLSVYVTRDDFTEYAGKTTKVLAKHDATLKEHGHQLDILLSSRPAPSPDSSAAPASTILTSLSTQPTVRGGLGSSTPVGTAPTPTPTLPAPPTETAPPGAASYDLPPHLAAYVKERFDKSDTKQTEILSKEDTIIGKLDEVATAVKGLTDRVTKIEQRLPATNPPIRPKPEVPQPE